MILNQFINQRLIIDERIFFLLFSSFCPFIFLIALEEQLKNNL